jgi:hypothetical protein
MTAVLDVGQRLEGLVERERLVDDRAEVAGVVVDGQLAQLGAVGLHEQAGSLRRADDSQA